MSSAADMSSVLPLRVVQISDTHLFADPSRELLGISTFASLAVVLNTVQQLQPRPDLLLLTGDLSQDESPKSYERLRDLIAPLNIPAYWIPGNHDQPLLMQDILCTSPLSTNKVFQQGGWNFILLSSMLPGEVHGELSVENLNWLDQQLQRSELPTLVALHHPPCPIGSAWIDPLGLHQPDLFYAVLDRYPQVKLVIFGHIHQHFEQMRSGVRYLGCPSTCVQFKPQSPDFAIDEARPGFRLFTLSTDGTCAVQVERVNYQPLPDLAATGY
jgi:3',5'-cyclic-AMP phosphodiesterase